MADEEAQFLNQQFQQFDEKSIRLGLRAMFTSGSCGKKEDPTNEECIKNAEPISAQAHEPGSFQYHALVVSLNSEHIRGFVRKVYGILSLQLVVTVCIMSAILFPVASKKYMIEHGDWVWGVSLAGVVIFSIIISCCDNIRRKWPTNVIFLAIFTVFESVFLGAVTSRYDTDAVLMAAGITAVITLGLTIFALQTKWDFTACGGILMVFMFALLGFGIICLLVRNQYANIAYASLGAFLFGLYLVFDTQLMLGGKHKYALSPEEYVYAALNLYIDIVNIFLYILSIIQNSRD